MVIVAASQFMKSWTISRPNFVQSAHRLAGSDWEIHLHSVVKTVATFVAVGAFPSSSLLPSLSISLGTAVCTILRFQTPLCLFTHAFPPFPVLQ